MSQFYFSKSNLSFYLSDIFGKNIPSDCVEISKDEYHRILQEESCGMVIAHDENGRPTTNPRPEAPISSILERVKDELREIRVDILDAITGIGFRANIDGNSDLAKEASSVSQKLLDITDDGGLNASKTYEEMRAAGLSAYRIIEKSVSQELKSAFNSLPTE